MLDVPCAIALAEVIAPAGGDRCPRAAASGFERAAQVPKLLDTEEMAAKILIL